MDRTAEAIRETLARETGIRLVRLDELALGKLSRNWLGLTADGGRLFVKWVELKAVERLHGLIDFYLKVEHPLLPRMKFGGRTFPLAAGEFCVMEFMRGENRFPEDLGAAAAASVAAALTSVRRVLGENIHGDLHYGNILFDGDEVVGIVDFEMRRKGAPIEDFLRGILHRAERLPLFAFVRKRRLLRYFLQLVRASGLPRDDWAAAIENYRLRKEGIRRRKSRFAPLLYLDLRFRRRTFNRFLSALAHAADDGPAAARESILVIKLSALGDIALATGAMKRIRADHPHARLTLLTRGAFAEFGRSMGLFDEVKIDNRERYAGFWKVGFKIVARGGYDIVYDLQGQSRTRTYRRIARLFAFRRIDWRTRVEDPFPPDLSFCRGPKEYFGELPEKYVLIIPGCSPGHPHKMWPVDNYRRFSEAAAARGFKSVVMGTKAEAETIAAICRGNPHALDFMGKTTLADIPELALRARAVVGNDTGPSHMARIAGARTVTLFCRRTESSARPGANAVNLIREAIGDITVEEVVAAAFA